MTGKMETFMGILVYIPNDILIETDEYYISYNNKDVNIYGCDTTAIVASDMTKFLILNGNHVKPYYEIIQKGGSYKDCIAYFKKHIEEKSRFSDLP